MSSSAGKGAAPPTAREKIIGIDLGTTNSAAAVMEAGRPVVVPSAEGQTAAGKMFPSVVAFTSDGQLLVGEPAKRQVVTNPDGTIFEIKRKMGTDYTVRIAGKEFTPQQISAFILQKIKKDAETFLGYPVKKAVITVPAHFNDNQRQATKDAGEIAGLDVVRIINEPTAACLAFGLDKTEKEMKVLVFSFGGGTHDVTVMEFGGGVFQVLATSGDTQTGGADIDYAIVNLIARATSRSKSGIDLKNDKTAMARLKEAAERAKIELSNIITTDIDLPFVASDSTGTKNLHFTLTRAKLEELARPDRGEGRGTHKRVIRTRSSRQGHREGHPHRRDDQDAARQAEGRGGDGQARGEGRRPDGGRRHRRGHPGRRAGRRGQGHPPARRHAALARGRDPGRTSRPR